MFRKAMLGDTALLSLDFSTGTMPSAVTFTRADSTARATYIDASGYVKTVTAAGDPRFDYTGGVAKGLLIEAAATNMCRWASDTGSWDGAQSGVTKTTETIVAPSGASTSVDRWVASASSYKTFVSSGGLATTNYTLSMWVRTVSGTATFGLRVNNLANGSNQAINNATVTTTWQRLQVTFNNTTAGSLQGGMVQWSAIGGSGTAMDVYVWGAQLEEGTVASSLIPTTTIALTRLADDAVIRSTAWTGLYAQPGAMVVEFYRGAYGAGDRSIMSTDTTATRHWHLKQANASATAQIAFSAGSPVTQTGLIAGLNKVAIAWNAPTPTASFDLCVNGATPTFGGSNVGTTLSTWLTLGSQSTTGVSGTGVWDGYLNNSIKSVKYYNALTYAEMQAKTT